MELIEGKYSLLTSMLNSIWIKQKTKKNVLINHGDELILVLFDIFWSKSMNVTRKNIKRDQHWLTLMYWKNLFFTIQRSSSEFLWYSIFQFVALIKYWQRFSRSPRLRGFTTLENFFWQKKIFHRINGEDYFRQSSLIVPVEKHLNRSLSRLILSIFHTTSSTRPDDDRKTWSTSLVDQDFLSFDGD